MRSLSLWRNDMNYLVNCNRKDFYFICASKAYALKAYFEAVGLEATVEAVYIVTKDES